MVQIMRDPIRDIELATGGFQIMRVGEIHQLSLQVIQPPKCRAVRAICDIRALWPFGPAAHSAAACP